MPVPRRTAKNNGKVIEGASALARDWARVRGISFSPTKSEIIHFTRACLAPTDTFKLGDNLEIAVAESTTS